MKVLHRVDSDERKHFLASGYGSYPLRPKFLYAGVVYPKPEWREVPHSHNFAEILFVAEGKGKIIANGYTYEVCQGDLALYNAGISHYEVSSATEPFKLLFVGLEGIKLDALADNALIPDYCQAVMSTAQTAKPLRIAFESLISETASNLPYCTELINCTLRQIVALSYRAIAANSDNMREALPKNKLITQAESFIADRILDKLTIEDIANHCYISKYYLIRLFRSEKGITPLEYINERRLALAQELLRDRSLSVSTVAERSGYNNLNYFCRRFRQAFTLSPSRYRSLYYPQAQTSPDPLL